VTRPREFVIRVATAADHEFVLATARRLAEFGPPPWRTADEVVAREQRALEEFFAGPKPGMAIFVAAGPDGDRLGFVYLTTEEEYFTGAPEGHVDIIAVAAAGEGKGVGSALLGVAERWAVALGYRRLTLNVFEGNRHAREVYERVGYQVETLRYVKALTQRRE
jgi:GNAT superfamily N-acetyltransferase